jgi:glycerophosphoryl diester phosphodiesterase
MQQVTIIGHRGAKGHPENTLPSFEAALDQGADGVELDVRLSGDGQLIVVHSPVVGGLLVKSTPFEKFRNLGNGYEIPLLEGVLKRFSGRTFLDIELKERGFEEQAIAMIKRHAEIKDVMISGLNTDMLNKVHELQPDVQLGFIYNRTQEEQSRHNSPIDFVIPQFRLASRELIEDVHDEDLQVFAWTVNQETEMRRLLSLGVNGIITDKPGLLARVLGR